MTQTTLRSEAVRQARDRLHEAMWEALERLLVAWAGANGVRFDKRVLEQALEKLTEELS